MTQCLLLLLGAACGAIFATAYHQGRIDEIKQQHRNEIDELRDQNEANLDAQETMYHDIINTKYPKARLLAQVSELDTVIDQLNKELS